MTACHGAEFAPLPEVITKEQLKAGFAAMGLNADEIQKGSVVFHRASVSFEQFAKDPKGRINLCAHDHTAERSGFCKRRVEIPLYTETDPLAWDDNDEAK